MELSGDANPNAWSFGASRATGTAGPPPEQRTRERLEIAVVVMRVLTALVELFRAVLGIFRIPQPA